DGRLRDEHARLRDHARGLADERILPLVSAPPLPDHGAAEAARAALQTFTREMIARMVVMGELMLAMLPEERRQSITEGEVK
ncbi:MAG TPA: hypothetical protein VE650_08535, partial [Acetobacteraceae bacterium]|nr:hypothetical protein [Acetobacteraceae bacterium]